MNDIWTFPRDAVTAGAPDGDAEVLQGLAVLCQPVQLGAPLGDVKHLSAWLAGGEVSHPGYGGGEGLPVTLGEVAEKLVRGLATVGRQEECPSYQLKIIFWCQVILVNDPVEIVMSWSGPFECDVPDKKTEGGRPARFDKRGD